MPDFAYTARSAAGQDSSGVISAGSRREAIALLADQALFPLTVEAREVASARRVRFGLRRRIKNELLADTLRSRGARVDCVACYRRAAPATGAAGLIEALRDSRAHAVTITSSEGLDNLWQVLGEAGRSLVKRLPWFAPHPRIAARGRALGLTMVETGPGDAGLIAGLLEWAGARAGH